MDHVVESNETVGMGQVRFREATADDAALLAAVHVRTVVFAYAGLFPSDAPPPTEESLGRDWHRAFADPSFRSFLAEDRSGALGGVAVRADPVLVGCGELYRLHVLPEHWGSGLGAALHDVARAMLRRRFSQAGLWVLAGNGRARRFYEGRGWALVEGQTRRAQGVVEVRYQRALRQMPGNKATSSSSM